MDKKLGRPTKAPKVEQYRLRMSAEEVSMLEYCCKKTGKSKADIFREGLKSVYERLKEQ